MKKRTAILILTLITIFCFVPMSTSAAESNVIRVSNQKEFEEAIARVNKDSDSEYTIELTADFSVNGFSITSPHKTTILGSGHTLTMGVGGSVSVSKGAELILGAADGNALNIRSAEGTNNDAPGMLNIEGTCNMYSGVTLSGREGNNYFGGGVTVSGGTFHMYGGTIEKCGIKGGSVCYGGGVAVVYGGQFIMDSGTIKDCYAESDYIDYWEPNTCFTAMGGGVFVSGGSYFRMNGGSISSNRATNMGGGVAVAISYDEIANSGSYGTLKSSAEILGGKVEENQAKKGAGLFASGYYYAFAAAICADTPAAGATENPGLHIKDTQILNNTSTDTADGMGGGVLAVALKSPAAASLENTTVKGNKATTGAGIASYESWTNLSIKGCTVTENTANKYGGGFSVESNTGGGKTTITDTVLCNNIADTAGSDVYLKKSPLVLPSAPSMNSIYLGAPEDVRNQKIDGWYEDKTDSRYTEQEKATRKEYTGYASIDGSGEVALIAAANPLVHIKFTNEDGSTVYKESYYPLGTAAKDIILPDATKASDEKYDYIFKGWSPTIKDATEDAVYTAVFEKVFKQFTVQYEFKSLTADKELPKEVTALLPKDPAGYGRNTDIKAIAPAKTEVKVDGGTWTFKGFDKDSKKATMENADGDGNVKFTGTWEFTPKDPDPLPSTGDMGTHLFIIVGAALMAAAAIAFVRNSKNSNKTK